MSLILLPTYIFSKYINFEKSFEKFTLYKLLSFKDVTK